MPSLAFCIRVVVTRMWPFLRDKPLFQPYLQPKRLCGKSLLPEMPNHQWKMLLQMQISCEYWYFLIISLNYSPSLRNGAKTCLPRSASARLWTEMSLGLRAKSTLQRAFHPPKQQNGKTSGDAARARNWTIPFIVKTVLSVSKVNMRSADVYKL